MLWMLQKALRLTTTASHFSLSRRIVVTHSLAPIMSKNGHSRVSSVLSDSVAFTCTIIVGHDRSAHISKRPALLCYTFGSFPPYTSYTNKLALL